MILWAFIITLLLSIILVIGYQKKDNDYLKFAASLQNTTKKYIASNHIKTGINNRTLVFVKELLDSNYINEEDSEKIKEYCIKSIVYEKGLFKDNYEFIKECENEE